MTEHDIPPSQPGEHPPDFPDVDLHTLIAIQEHAQALADWLKAEAQAAKLHGHVSSQHSRRVLEGWQFVAEAFAELVETYDD